MSRFPLTLAEGERYYKHPDAAGAGRLRRDSAFDVPRGRNECTRRLDDFLRPRLAAI